MNRVICLIVLAIALFPGGVLAGETRYEKHIARGIAAMEQQRYQEAAEEFRSALTERPADRTATLYLGTSMSRSGDAGAASVLKKAYDLDPQDPRANLEMGIYDYRRAGYQAGAEYFERTIQLAPKSELAEKAEEYLKAGKKGGGKPWSAGFQAGIQYDSNVVLSGIDGLLPQGISHKADWRLVFNLKARYMLVRQQHGEVWVGYSGYQSLHNRLQKFNLAQQQLEAGAGYILSSVLALRASYVYEYDLVGGDDFNAAHLFSPSLIISEGKGLSTLLSYSYRKNHYFNSELFSENHDRSGSTNSFGLFQNVRILETLQVRAGYLHVVESTGKDYWDYRGDQGTLDIRLALPQKAALTIGCAYEKRDY
ncbi:MAG: hypothetical protein C0402_13055, partial [Thermodesulfovibrio sp.]|nr:hypothetical protein [Thermodesulfovibrio sp.]